MDPISFQKNIKDNAEDLQTYLRDLSNWESNIKKKDAELRGVDIKEGPCSEIRSKAVQQKNYNDMKLSEIKNCPKNQRISGSDYASWDKIDIDKMCDEIDTNEAQKMRETAIYEKEKGNNYVKAGKWEEAISCYTKAIKSCPNDAIFFANRALCYLKIKDFQKAERDSTKAIELNSEYAKAWLRRYAAHEGLGKLELAKCDLQRVLYLEPYNMEAQSNLTALEKRLKEEEEERHPEKKTEIVKTEEQKLLELQENVFGPKAFSLEVDGNELPPSWTTVEGTRIEPIQKPPHLRSKKPLRRVPITEEFGNDLVPEVGESPILKNACSTEQKVIANEPGEESAEIVEPPPSEVPSAPRTSVQFLLVWKVIKLHPEIAIKYLQKIPPESLPVIFGDSLDISTLEEILNVIGKNAWESMPAEESLSTKRHTLFEFLKCITSVARFSFLAMFLRPDEKELTKQLLDSCVHNGTCSSEEAADVASKFML